MMSNFLYYLATLVNMSPISSTEFIMQDYKLNKVLLESRNIWEIFRTVPLQLREKFQKILIKIFREIFLQHDLPWLLTQFVDVSILQK